MDFGRKLREARERRGISVRQIASATKISVSVLEALERNEISRLPGGIFSRAFVRSYAVQVGLDPEATVQEFIDQFPHGAVTAGHPASDPVEDREAIESDRRTASTFLGMVVLSVPLVALVIYLTINGTWFLRRPSEAGDAAPPSAAPAQALPAAAALARAGVPDASGTPAPAATPEPAVGERLPAAASATPPPSPPSDDHLAIRLSVTRPCWVSATVDGQKTLERLLQPGEAHSIDVRRELVLTAGDAAAVAMTVNGIEAKPLGKAGEVVTRRVTLANFKEYVQSR